MKSYTLGITKEEFVNELKWHQEQDHFIKGQYINGSKGCAVGCAIKSINKLTGKRLDCSNHYYLEKFGICPEWLAEVEDTLFEGMSLERSKKWPIEFAEAINVGADLNDIKTDFLMIILQFNIDTLSALDVSDPVIKQSIDANQQTIEALLSCDTNLISSAESAARAAESAAWYARDAANSAAWYAAESARDAAWSVDWSAWHAARAATESAAWEAKFEYFADELLKLIHNCR